jgi:small subunit ribosomal protein S3
MGRKVHPIGFRLKINRTWGGRWFAEGADYVDKLHEDLAIRKRIPAIFAEDEKKGNPGISQVEIERFPGKLKVTVHTARPGVMIGRKGETIKEIRKDLEEMTGEKVDLDIKEIKAPELDAFLVARNIAEQIERRVSYRRAMSRAMQATMRQGAQGIKVMAAGRLGGAEMARTVWLREGRVPLQTLRADIDFAKTEAWTTYGQIGIKVWIYRGEVLGTLEEQAESTEGVYVSE